MAQQTVRVASFDLSPGQKVGGKYRVEDFLGGGLEGEVYRVTELQTGIRRAAKLFYPQENRSNRAARTYARRLDRLRDCPIVIQYHHAERVTVEDVPVTCLISEFVDGILLSDFIAAHRGKRLPPFKALHLLYAVVRGVEQIHVRHEYHGDLHSANILIRPRGIFFDAKLVDFYNQGTTNASHRRGDVVDLVHLLHEMTGGRRHYARQPVAIKAICRGLRRDLIKKAFPTATHLRRHLETTAELATV
ncbi:MAG: protein kinase family protein [Alphaproteobacteria bacterium]|nr:protein kinase family protein [Alphaproteobacteria bacterium]